MLVKFAKESYTIAAGKLVSGKVSRPQTLHVASGRVWLTVTGEAADHWLTAGDVFSLPVGRLIVIEADKGASEIQFKKNHVALPVAENLAKFSQPKASAPCHA